MPDDAKPGGEHLRLDLLGSEGVLEADARGHEEQVVTGLQTLVRPRELREPRDDVDPSSRRMEIDDLKRAIGTVSGQFSFPGHEKRAPRPQWWPWKDKRRDTARNHRQG